MKMKKLWEDEAWDEYEQWLIDDKKIVKKINDLIKSIDRDGILEGLGKPEKLKYRKNEYSRRIDEKNRLIYKVQDNMIIIVSCKGHYEKEFQEIKF